jgi:hypothetical protein
MILGGTTVLEAGLYTKTTDPGIDDRFQSVTGQISDQQRTLDALQENQARLELAQATALVCPPRNRP